MQQQDHVWHLLAVYLTGQASVAERKEWEEMIANDADLKKIVAVFTEMWHAANGQGMDEVAVAWNKHRERISRA